MLDKEHILFSKYRTNNWNKQKTNKPHTYLSELVSVVVHIQIGFLCEPAISDEFKVFTSWY